MGELHLDIKVDILKRTYDVEANVGAPQVAYRETLARPTDIDYTHKKQTGGTGQFARVKLQLEPNETGKGNEFETSRSSAARCRRSTSPASRRASVGLGQRRPHRLPDGRHEGHALRRRLPRSGLVGHRLRDRGAVGHEGRLREGRREAARADHGRRSGDRPAMFVGGVIGDINCRRGQIRIRRCAATQR